MAVIVVVVLVRAARRAGSIAVRETPKPVLSLRGAMKADENCKNRLIWGNVRNLKPTGWRVEEVMVVFVVGRIEEHLLLGHIHHHEHHVERSALHHHQARHHGGRDQQ